MKDDSIEILLTVDEISLLHKGARIIDVTKIVKDRYGHGLLKEIITAVRAYAYAMGRYHNCDTCQGKGYVID